MSNGSITELVAKGVQDCELIDSNNSSSLFDFNIIKKNKYTKGDILFFPQGTSNWGNTLRINIERVGDLLYGLYIKIKLPKLSINNLLINSPPSEFDTTSQYRVMYTDYVGNVIIEKVSLYINGILIDELYGDYMQIYTDLYISDWNRKAMLGLDDILNKPNLKIDSEVIYIPLKFWFCTDQKKPLPVIALQNSDIYIDIKLRDFNDCICVLEIHNDKYYHSDVKHKIVPLEEVSLLACFYYADSEERKVLASRDYEIVITQTQVREKEISSNIILEIDFNNIVKDIFFFVQPLKHIKYGEFFNWTSKMNYLPADFLPYTPAQLLLWDYEPSRHLLVKARLVFNGIERIEWRDYKYFHFMQNHENYKNSLYSYVYMYSFNINPTKDQSHSGCNFSRLSNTQLHAVIQTNTFTVNNTIPIIYPKYETSIFKCYATNFNILVIKNGICGLKY
jgi:hypothetical protein